MGIFGRRRSSSPLSLLAMLALVAIAVAYVRGRTPDQEGPERASTDAAGAPAPVEPGGCETSAADECALGIAQPRGPEETYLEADEVCVDVGYLCADVERNGVLRIMRWPEDSRRLRVRVPLPREDDPGRARRLQRAAVRGIMAWHGHPFDLVVDDRRRPGGEADIQIRWASTLGGDQLGVTEVDWRKRGEEVRFRVRALTLSTRHPRNPRLTLDERQVMLTAAHEMGHALGLPHSDDSRDVMYPQNTATSLSAQDYRTLEALYRLPNGALIRE